MAMIDYGAILFINGVQQNHEMFMDMQEAVGWVDFPRIRYSDCDCLRTVGGFDGPDYLESNCWECPRSKKERISDDWENIVGDCKGNQVSRPNKIDGNYFVYAGDKHLTIAVYKTWFLVMVDGAIVHTVSESDFYVEFGRNRKSLRFECAGVKFHVRSVGGRQYWLQWSYKDDYYNIIYGYGIDPDTRVWNKVKYKYCGRKVAKRIDRIFQRITRK